VHEYGKEVDVTLRRADRTEEDVVEGLRVVLAMRG
jgi:hypothetical protein